VKVLDYGEASDFCTVELSGESCTDLRNEGCAALYADLHRSSPRVQASRVDFAWDGVPFTVLQALEAVKRGDINSRSVTREAGDPPSWRLIESSSRTLYLGRRSGDRMVRIYDWRGPVRLEVELKGIQARSGVEWLYQRDPSSWGRIVMASVRQHCDFVDRSADGQVVRCPLLPWWAQFVGDVERGNLPTLGPDDYKLAPTAIGKADGLLQRYALPLEAMRRAYGDQWLLDRIALHGRRKWSGKCEASVAALVKFKGSGLAGVPSREVGPIVPILHTRYDPGIWPD
jgi:hypothetical protein